MNVVVPLGGVGRRFRECGYARPKPLVRALGKEILFWLLDSLELRDGDEVYIPYNESLERHNFSRSVSLRHPRARTLPLADTRGAAETVKLCVDHFGIEGRLCVLDGDTWYEEDILAKAREGRGNMVACFHSPSPEPIYSYVLEAGGAVRDIREKEKISDLACSGCYVFSDAARFSRAVSSMDLDRPGETYMSQAIARMISEGEEFRAFEVERFHVLGTPEQLIEFSKGRAGEPKRFCFDLDNTLVTAPRVAGDYGTVEPIQETINYLRGLKERGHTIIIYTARRMRTHSGNVGAVLADVAGVTMETLGRFGIPYDELHFGKPYAHFYVDDLMVDPRSDLGKEVGFYTEEVRPRHFNKVEAGKTFRKTSSDTRRLAGEIHYHQWVRDNCHAEVAGMFPRMVSCGEGFLETEAIQGLNFSTLYVNEILDERTLGLLLSSLETLHSVREGGGARFGYANFSPKLLLRLSMYDHESMGVARDAVARLAADLDAVAAEGYERVMIHGDPVFGNVMLDREGRVRMVDMRGAEGDELTVFGHPLYDLAKVYQSLCGYDEALLGKEVRASYRWRMRTHFERRFDARTMGRIAKIAASLLLSLIPLHEDDHRRQRYADIALGLLRGAHNGEETGREDDGQRP